MGFSRTLLSGLAASALVLSALPATASAQLPASSMPAVPQSGQLTQASSEAASVPAAQALKYATLLHLQAMGHHRNEEAQAIAQDWANQAARGEVEFLGGVGTGNTSLDRGTGNIYRLSPRQAAQRVAWLLQPTNRTDSGHGFGVAASDADGNVYLAEFFLD